MHTSANKICRTCMKTIRGNDNFTCLNNSDSSSTSTFHCKLMEFYPEINLTITPDAVICSECSAALMISHQFKQKCRNTEERLNTYIQENGLNSNGHVNFNDVFLLDTKLEVFECIEIDDSSDDDTSLKENSHKNLGLPQLEVVESNSVLCNTTDVFNTKDAQQYYKCNQCGYNTGFKGALSVHLKAHRKITAQGHKRKCSLCTYTCFSKKCLKKHMTCHLDKPYHCNLCDFRTKFPSSLNSHLRVHTGKQPYDCNECDYATIYRAAFVNHKKIHALENKVVARFRCGLCSFVGETKEKLDKHSDSHKNINEKIGYRCKLCLTFKTKSYVCFKMHLRLHGSDKLFRCCWCSFSTKFRNSLIVHVRQHTGE